MLLFWKLEPNIFLIIFITGEDHVTWIRMAVNSKSHNQYYDNAGLRHDRYALSRACLADPSTSFSFLKTEPVLR